MLKTTSVLMDEYRSYTDSAGKIKRLADKGIIIPVVRGLYETDKNTPGEYLAAAIYGPSYLSFEFMLSRYSLIPEAVYTFTSAAFEKKKSKIYHTFFGTYTYRDVPSDAYPLDVILKTEAGYSMAVASPEKAVCDLLYTISPCRNQKEFSFLLFEDLRIDENEFRKLDMQKLREISGYYHTKNHHLLISMINRRYL